MFYRRSIPTPPTISEVVVGEVFLTIATDASAGLVPVTVATDASRRLIDAVRGDRLRLCGHGAHEAGDTAEIAARLRRGDNRLEFTDSVVAAAALACEDCRVLYTNDPKLLGCRPLLSLADAKPMKIQEAP